jgi:hypothetical protein
MPTDRYGVVTIHKYLKNSIFQTKGGQNEKVATIGSGINLSFSGRLICQIAEKEI